MPRRATHETADILADRLINRGHEGSREWVSAWVRRWGAIVARDTEDNPVFTHPIVSKTNNESFVRIGVDEIEINLYREWKDIQDGSRKIIGAVGAPPRWED
jgi:hypothetical protein